MTRRRSRRWRGCAQARPSDRAPRGSRPRASSLAATRPARCRRRADRRRARGRRPMIDRKADLLLEKGMVARRRAARRAGGARGVREVLELRKDDAMATEALEELGSRRRTGRSSRRSIIQEATRVDRSQPRDRAATCRRPSAYVRFAARGARGRGSYLRKALEIDPKNGKAAFHLARLLRRGERWAGSRRSSSTSARSRRRRSRRRSRR